MPAANSRESAQMPRIVLRVVVLGLLSLAALYGFHRLEEFLIHDPRFALNGPDGAADGETLEIEGPAHASASEIARVFSDDLGRSVYLLPLADRRAALRTVNWVQDASVARMCSNLVVVGVT